MSHKEAYRLACWWQRLYRHYGDRILYQYAEVKPIFLKHFPRQWNAAVSLYEVEKEESG